MKKTICIIMTFFVFIGATFSQDSGKWTDKLSAGGLVRLGLFTTGVEIHTRYEFPLTENIHVDAGLNVNTCMKSFLGTLLSGVNEFGTRGSVVENGGDRDSVKSEIGTFSIIPNVSLWFKDFYIFYGLGIGTAFIPYDIRIGWQPGNTKKDKGVCFNMETGITGTPWITEYEDENKEIVRKVERLPDFFISLGAMYKF